MANVRNVTSTLDDGEGTLRDALRSTPLYTSGWETLANGDTITFDNSLEVNGVITITLAADSAALSIPAYEFTIEGGATWTESGVLKTRVVIDAAASVDDLRRVATLAARCKATINGVTFKNGYQSDSAYGGGVQLSDANTNVIFNNCVFDTCNAPYGGAVIATNATVNFNNCKFYNNTASTRGGGIYSTGAATVNFNNCDFIDCIVTSGGGGAFYANMTSNNTLLNCYFKNCYASSSSGVFWVNSTPTITCTNCTFDYCRATGGTGGVITLNVAAVVTFNNCTFTDCRASSHGQAIYYGTSAALTLNGCTFTTTQNKPDVYNLSTTGTIIIKGINTVDKMGFNSGSSVTFDGVDAVLTITDTLTDPGATWTAAENSRGYIAIPSGTTPPTVGANIKIATYSTATPTISATITGRDASVDIKNAGSGYITEIEYADGTVDDLTITEGAAEIAVDKAFKIRLFNGAFYYSPFVPRTYYLKTYDVDGDFATAADWTLDAAKTLTCNAAPTIQDGTFYCTAPPEV